MKIPFEVVHRIFPHGNVIGLFAEFGAHINNDTMTVEIDPSKVELLREMAVMGAVIDCYVNQQPAGQDTPE